MTILGANGQPVEIVDIDGRGIEVDIEIAPIVRALNAAGAATVASCSGHGHRPGNIALADGREIIIAASFDEARQIDALFPTDINGRPLPARGAEAERARIVAWLREEARKAKVAGCIAPDRVLAQDIIATAIESGDHLKGEGD